MAKLSLKHSAIRWEFWLGVLLVLSTVAVYGQVGTFEFVNFDDPYYVADNAYVQRGFTRETFKWAFTEATQVTNYFAPLTWLSFILDFELYGPRPGGYHVTNLILHLVNSLLLLIVCRRMTNTLWRSWFVAALFALHPLHVESVAWVTERKDVLSMFWGLLAMWAYLRYAGSQKVRWYLFALAGFTAGLMSKPMLVTLPFVLLLVDYWPLDRLDHRGKGVPGRDGSALKRGSRPWLTWKALLVEKAPFMAIVGLFSVAAFITQQQGGAVKALSDFPFGVRLTNMLVAYVDYIIKMLWPYNLAVLYPHPGVLPVAKPLMAMVVLTVITGISIYKMKRFPWLSVGWFWYLGSLFPVSGIVVIGPHAVADRYAYFPLIGLYIIVTWGLRELFVRLRVGKALVGLLAFVYLFVLVGTAWIQVGYWRDSISLFTHALNVTIAHTSAHMNLGNALFEKGRADEALFHYLEVVRIDPTNEDGYFNLGVVMEKKGRLGQARRYYQKALAINPALVGGHLNLGRLDGQQGMLEDAAFHYRAVLETDATHAQAMNGMGDLLFKQGRLDEALVYFRKAVRVKPDYVDAYNNIGVVLIHKGDMDGAVRYLQQALRLNPVHKGARANLKNLKRLQNNHP